MSKMHTHKLVAVLFCLVGCALAPSLVGAKRPKRAMSPSEHVARALAAADDHRDAKRYDKALYEYNKVLFVQPKNGKAKKGVAKVSKAKAEASLEKAKALWDSKPDEAMRHLKEAYEIAPAHRTVKSLFKKHGYRLHEGRWLTKNEIKQFEADRKRRGHARRSQLGLSRHFNVIHRGPLRLFTNLDVKKASGNLIEEILQANLTHYREYTKMMRPLGVRFPTEGIDMVLFSNRGAYMSYTQAEGSAGIYFPSKQCGFFFKDSGSVSFPTMLHEMTHQLSHKVLLGLGLSGWFEEGMAEYFGAGLLTQGGRRLRLGFSDAYRLQVFHRTVGNRGSGLIPLDRFVDMPNAELTGRFYAQAWALVNYLMEADPYGRLIVYDYIASGKLARVEKNSPYMSFSLKEVLKRYGRTLDQLEADYVKYYRRG